MSLVLAWVATFLLVFAAGLLLRRLGEHRQVWVVGRTVGPNPARWIIEGIYGTSRAAREACTSADHFVGPVTLNQPMQGTEWPGAFYPRRPQVQEVARARS